MSVLKSNENGEVGCRAGGSISYKLKYLLVLVLQMSLCRLLRFLHGLPYRGGWLSTGLSTGLSSRLSIMSISSCSGALSSLDVLGGLCGLGLERLRYEQRRRGESV